MHQFGYLRCVLGADVVALADQLGHRAHRQGPQVQCGAAHRCGQGKGGTAGWGIIAPGKDQQQIAGRVSQQLRQQLLAGVVDPLQVIEEQHQRLAGAAEHLQELDDRPQLLLQRQARGLGRQLGQGAEDQLQVWRQLAQQPAVAFDAAQHLAAQGVEVLAVLGQQLGGQRAENLDPGRVGHCLGNAIAFAGGPVTLGVGLECCLDQARLAHAGSPIDEQGLWLAVSAQGLEQQGDGLLLGAAAIQACAVGRDRVGTAWLEGLHGFAGGPLPLAMGQVNRQGAGTLVAGIRLFGQGLGQDPAERLRHIAVHFAGRSWLHARMQLAPVLGVASG